MRKIATKLLVAVAMCAALFGLMACSPSAEDATQAESITGTVFEIEKYGHANLDVTVEEFMAAGYEYGDIVTVTFDGYEADMPFYSGYYSNAGDPLLRAKDSDETIAVCINYHSLADETGIAVGDTVSITLREKGGALEMQELCAMDLPVDRSLFPDDATFANFRAITVGRIAEGTLYRSASPVNDEYKRAKYANDCAEGVGVATVMNLADPYEDLEGYFAEEGFASHYYQDLYDAGQVIALDQPASFHTDEYAQSLVRGFEFLADNETPYLIHCKKGQDRAGYALLVVEALSGATLEEIEADYMTSYRNYYGVTKESDPEKYQAVVDLNLMAMLHFITGTEEGDSLEGVDLEAAATQYLLDAGMDEEKLNTLKAKLAG